MVNMDISMKLGSLRQLNQKVQQLDDAISLYEFLPGILELQSDQHSPVRKLATEIIGSIGMKHLEFVPEIVPILMGILDDCTPAVARQAIISGIGLFQSTLEKTAIQGLSNNTLDDLFKSSWSSILEFKEKIYSIAFQPGSGGVRILALKFVETVVLLYTHAPNAPPDPPQNEGKLREFNISWLRVGHPILNVGDLSIEASKRLGLLLDLLRLPTVKSLNYLAVIVLVNSLAAIAKKRPPYYGRILPVLLGLDPSSLFNEALQVFSTYHALKKALLLCLNCTHPGAAPWRDRLISAVSEIKVGGLCEETLNQTSKVTGVAVELNGDLLVVKEERSSSISSHESNLHNQLGRKRSRVDNGDVSDVDDVSPKHGMPRAILVEESTEEELIWDTPAAQNDSGPVQQLVAMVGALVAQGEKANESLDILISNISADLLAEVVMANMCNLPAICPMVEGDDKSLFNITVGGSGIEDRYPSFLSNVLSLSTTSSPISLFPSAHQLMSDEAAMSYGMHGFSETIVGGNNPLYIGTENEMHTSSGNLGASPNVILCGGEKDSFSAPDIPDIGDLETVIPGLEFSDHCHDLLESMDVSILASTDLEDGSQVQGSCLDATSTQDLLHVMLIEGSEEVPLKGAGIDSNSPPISSTTISIGVPSAIVLPKLSSPVVNLTNEQQEQLHNLVFTRIVEARQQIVASGGSQIRFSLLSYFGVKFLSELDPWKLLKKHILSDYTGHEGHELTLRVLYRLFEEVEEDRDFFSSTSAASEYDTFLLSVVETLRDSFPPSDRSLCRLLGEAPYLPKSIFDLLESFCSPRTLDKDGNYLQGGDRVTQGLTSIWNLVVMRPPLRESCLKIVLQCAVHSLEDVRLKAIRLVANKLYPISSITKQIEDFSIDMLLSVARDNSIETKILEGSTIESQKSLNVEKGSAVDEPQSCTMKENVCDSHQSFECQSLSSLSYADAERGISLYFALCTKKHALIRQIFVIYKSSLMALKQAVRHQIPIIVRTIGLSSDLLEIISDPPDGCEDLLIQVLQILTDGAVLSPELLFAIKKLYESNLKDLDVLFPILPLLPNDEVLLIFPRLVNLSLDKFQAALELLLKGSAHSNDVLTAADVLIAIHGIDPDRDGIPLKKITDACNACFELRDIFTQQTVAKALNQLVERIPLPLLFMRTVLQTIGAYPALVDFILDILSRLVSKQIWKFPKLWVGFLKCALSTKPQSFSILLQLPPAQLGNALARTPALKAPLVAHASRQDIKASLPKSILAVLGIDAEPRTPAVQARTSEAQNQDTADSTPETTPTNKTEASADA